MSPQPSSQEPLEQKHTLQDIQPSDVYLGSGLIGSIFNNSEKETIATNLIIMAKKEGDQWGLFTWRDYSAACDHEVTDSERGVLDSLVASGYLDFDALGGKYSFTDQFAVVIEPYRETPEYQRTRAMESASVTAARAEEDARARAFLTEFSRDLDFDSLRSLAQSHGFEISSVDHDAGGTSIWIRTQASDYRIGSGDTLDTALADSLERIGRQGLVGVSVPRA